MKLKKIIYTRKYIDIIIGTIIMFSAIYFSDKELSINSIFEGIKTLRFYILIFSSFLVSYFIRYIILKSYSK